MSGVSADLESQYWRALVDSPQGRWLLRNLITSSRALLQKKRKPGAEGSYDNGKEDLVVDEVISRLTKFCGFAILDRVMKEEK